LRVELVSDEQIKARIVSEAREYVWCPHSATALEAWTRLSESERSERPWIVAATAHPYKFAETVEPLIGRRIDPTHALAAILDRPQHKIRIGANLGELREALHKRAIAA
jgi:threonine synthase